MKQENMSRGCYSSNYLFNLLLFFKKKIRLIAYMATLVDVFRGHQPESLLIPLFVAILSPPKDKCGDNLSPLILISGDLANVAMKTISHQFFILARHRKGLFVSTFSGDNIEVATECITFCGSHQSCY